MVQGEQGLGSKSAVADAAGTKLREFISASDSQHEERRARALFTW